MPKSDGWFKPGESGNPGGRTTNLAVVKARSLTDKCFEVLKAALDNPKERMQAVQICLDRGWGKPKEQVEAVNYNVDVTSGIDAPPLPESLDEWLQRRRSELDKQLH